VRALVERIILPLLYTALAVSIAAFVHEEHDPPDVYPRTHAIFDPPSLVAPSAPPFEVHGTAYCSCAVCCGKWAKWGLTRIGVKPREGWTVAADPRVFPLRSCVRIEGKVYRVQDTGSAIKGAKIDFYIADHERAKQFGVQRLGIEPWVCNGLGKP